MNCCKVRNLISAYVDCELSGVEMLAIRHHLGLCAECRLDFDRTLAIKRSFGSLPYKQAPEGLGEQICRGLDRVAVPGYVRLWSTLARYQALRGRRTFASAAIALAVLLLLYRPGGELEFSGSSMARSPVMEAIGFSNHRRSPEQFFGSASHVTAFASAPLRAPADRGLLNVMEAGGPGSGGTISLAGFSTR